MPRMLSREWRLPDGGFLLVGDNVIESVSRYRQSESQDTEAGGILLGYRRDPHLEILLATEPGPRDIRRRTFFERCDPSHQLLATRAWEADAYMHYLGEWHTHPESSPTPSALDRREWSALGRRWSDESLVMIIVGQGGSWVGLQFGTQCRTLAVVI